MTDTVKSSNTFNSEDIIVFIFKKWKILAICSILAAILSAVFSGPAFITPMYKSTVVFYPAATSSISKALLANGSNSRDVLAFGDEEETEQLLQILNSNSIRDQIINEFDLQKHYEIADDAKYLKTALYREYASNFKFKRTEYMAIEVSVKDKDAQKAADMANRVGELLDQVKTDMYRERASKALAIVEEAYQSLEEEIRIKEDSLDFLRSKGVHDYAAQVEMINQQLAIELGAGNQSGAKRLQKELDILAKYGSAHISLTEALMHDLSLLNGLKLQYTKAKIDAEADMSHKFIVDNAYKADKKASPVRWLIVVLSTASVFFLTLIFVFVIDRLKQQ